MKTRAELQREIAKATTPAAPRLRLLGHVTGLPVYLVSGERVRNTLDLDFTQGGTDAAYPSYIPKGEIWIDDAMHTLDRIATIFHEITERNMVLYGGVDYDRAHDRALEREAKLRQRLMANPPRTVDLRIVEAALAPYAHEAQPSGKRPGKASRTKTVKAT